MRPRPRLAAYGLVMAVLGMSCVSFGPGIPGTPCPVEWTPSGSIDEAAASFRARMRLRVGDEEIHLELITEARSGEQVVVALSQYGSRLFAIHQRDMDVTVVGASSRELEQVALWVLDALHRAYWIRADFDSEGDLEFGNGRWAGEHVKLAREGGLWIREFTLPDFGSTTGRVTIEYNQGKAGEARPKVTIRNPWCGYDAVIIPI